MLLMSAELLDRLLTEIECCPDDKLADNFGLKENYTLLLKGNFADIARELYSSGQWIYSPKKTLAQKLEAQHRMFDYSTGVVAADIIDSIVIFTPDDDLQEAMNNRYNISLMMMASIGEDNTTNLDDMRVFANAVCDLVRYVKDRRIPAYFAKSKLDGVPVEFQPDV